MRNSRKIARGLALAAVAAGAAIVAVVLLTGGSEYTVRGYFLNASQLVKGNQVEVAGAPIGKVKSIDLTPNGQAVIRMSITDQRFVPLRQGTHATVRLFSLSGVASRYVDLTMPSGEPAKIPDNGVIGTQDTTSTVDLDELFNTFDPPTRRALSGFIRGNAEQYQGKEAAANRGLQYLNPALATSSRLFRELNYDTPLLTRFIVANSKLVTDLASRKDQLAGLVTNLNTTFNAIGRKNIALQRAIMLLPPFMRRANTTFVNLRGTLDRLQPLVDESKPVAPKLRKLLAKLRPLTHDARPTLRDLSRLIYQPGANNDLIDATNTNVPVRNIAVGPVQRNGAQHPGALPESTTALAQATPELSYARPYVVDLTGWFDDFGESGIYDALGGIARNSPHFNAFAFVNGNTCGTTTGTTPTPTLPGGLGGVLPVPVNPGATLCPIFNNLERNLVMQSSAQLDQRDRCPGADELGAVYKPSPDYPCDPRQVASNNPPPRQR